MRIPSPSLPIYTVNSYLSQFFLHRCEDILRGSEGGLPFPHDAGPSCPIYRFVVYYFLPKPPGAIMVPSGIWAKVLLRPSCKASAIA